MDAQLLDPFSPSPRNRRFLLRVLLRLQMMIQLLILQLRLLIQLLILQLRLLMQLVRWGPCVEFRAVSS